MQEISFRIRFLRECLGAERRLLEGEGDVFCMHHGGGHIIFLPSWWKAITRYAATLRNIPHELVERIDWDPVVSGTTHRWRRYLPAPPGHLPARRRFAKHEAFRAGDRLDVNCVLPDGLSLADFHELMVLAGRYKGISPYKPGQYGSFEVEAVNPRRLGIPAATPEV